MAILSETYPKCTYGVKHYCKR